MKKLVCLLLALMCIIGLAGCGETEGTSGSNETLGNTTTTNSETQAKAEELTFDDFLAKYKRKDISELGENPQEFVRDFISVYSTAKAIDFEDDWWETDTDEAWNYEVVLYGTAASANAFKGVFGEGEEYISNCAMVKLDLDDAEENGRIAKLLCEAVFKELGDALFILGEDEQEVTEYWLRSHWGDGSGLEEYECFWQIDGGYIAVVYFSGKYSSSVGLMAFEEYGAQTFGSSE